MRFGEIQAYLDRGVDVDVVTTGPIREEYGTYVNAFRNALAGQLRVENDEHLYPIVSGLTEEGVVDQAVADSFVELRAWVQEHFNLPHAPRRIISGSSTITTPFEEVETPTESEEGLRELLRAVEHGSDADFVTCPQLKETLN